MQVCAAPGAKVPKEGKRGEYVTDDPKGEEVPDTHYYRALVRDGSLTEIPAPKPKTSGGNK